MIDPNTETLLSLSEAGKHLPRRRAGKRPHVSCIYRWTTAGCRGIVLESIQIGGTRCTSRKALARFFQQLTGNQVVIPVVTSRAHKAAVAAAERRLDAAGI
ncbi:MAG: DUF1580 domain-containing protein [Planctomycetes bacterium]|nr:DUF1580 domain-containing protein [Planctomycetota bacterium]MBU4400093.1 DUF1580 domain-containing protein [Planctomycetota bacterium]